MIKTDEYSINRLVFRVMGFPLKFARNLVRKAGWYNTSLRVRVILLTLLVMLVQGLASAGLGIRLYWQDRKAYLFENHQLRAELVFSQLHDSILRHLKPQPFLPTKSDPIFLQRNYHIPRMPEPGEIFVGTYKEKPVAIWRTQSAPTTYISDYQFYENSCPTNAGMCYLVSGNGTLLGTSHPQLMGEKTFRERETLIQAIKGGMRNGFRFVKSEGSLQEVAVTYQEAPGTNIYVFIETTTSGLVMAAQTFLTKMMLLQITALIGFGVVLGSVLEAILEPLKRLLAAFKNIENGKYIVNVIHHYEDEISELIGGAKRMASKLSDRERTIVGIQRNLNSVLHVTHELTLTETIDEVVNTAVVGIGENLTEQENTVAAVIWWEQIEGVVQTEKLRIIPLTKKESANSNDHKDGNNNNDRNENNASKDHTKQKSMMNKTITASSELDIVKTGNEVSQHGTLVIIPVHMQNGKKVCTLLLLRSSDTSLTQQQRHYISTLMNSVSILFENISQRHKMKSLALLEFELETANTLQSTLLAEAPHIENWKLDTFFQPAQHVAGDWYAFHYEKETGLLYALLGDATGHGLAPAMVTVNACGAFFSAIWTHNSKEQCTLEQSERMFLDVMDTMSRSILRAAGGNILMTCLGVVIDVNTGEGLLVNAGHHAGLIRNAATGKVIAVQAMGEILGMGIGKDREVKKFKMAEGDSLVLYTDGLVENTGPNEARLSSRQLRKAIEEGEDETKNLATSIANKAKNVWKNEPGNDDVTVVCLTRTKNTVAS